MAGYANLAVPSSMRGRKYTEWLPNHTYYKHIGLYAYRADTLKEITHLPQSPLELAGKPGTTALARKRLQDQSWNYPAGNSCIDTPEDMEKALAFLKNREYQPTNDRNIRIRNAGWLWRPAFLFIPSDSTSQRLMVILPLLFLSFQLGLLSFLGFFQTFHERDFFIGFFLFFNLANSLSSLIV